MTRRLLGFFSWRWKR